MPKARYWSVGYRGNGLGGAGGTGGDVFWVEIASIIASATTSLRCAIASTFFLFFCKGVFIGAFIYRSSGKI